MKQIVKYDAQRGVIFESWPNGETRATLTPVNHPDTLFVENGKPALTSPIVRRVDKDGTFETKNSVYVPWYADAQRELERIAQGAKA